MLQARSSSSLKVVLSLVLLLLLALVLLYNSLRKASLVDGASAATIFPQGRSVQNFQLKNFSTKNLEQHWTLLLFGYTHCSDVCPMTLGTLNTVYQQLYNAHPELQVVFVSLDPERDSSRTVQNYVSSFNKNFIGVSGTKAQLKSLQEQFGIFAEREGLSANYAINHSNPILVINPHGKWLGLLPFGLKPTTVQEALKNMMGSTL